LQVAAARYSQKTSEAARKMGLFGPNSVLPNQLQVKMFFRGKPQKATP
jgi:hypothetical protein